MRFLYMICCALILSACSNEETTEAQVQETKREMAEDLTPPPNSKLRVLSDSAKSDESGLVDKSVEHHVENHLIENPNEKVRLNDGKKWVADSELVDHVEVMQFILNDFAPEGLGDYHATAKVLDAQLSELIKSCKMKGEAHDELHNWLLPVMQKIEALGKVEDEEMAVALTESLQASLTNFHNYFEKG